MPRPDNTEREPEVDNASGYPKVCRCCFHSHGWDGWWIMSCTSRVSKNKKGCDRWAPLEDPRLRNENKKGSTDVIADRTAT